MAPRFAVDLAQRQTHRDAHEERLRQLDARCRAHAGSSGRRASAGRGYWNCRSRSGFSAAAMRAEVEAAEFGIEQLGRRCRS